MLLLPERSENATTGTCRHGHGTDRALIIRLEMMSPHQMPAANPEPERLGDDKNIHAKVDNKLDPAVQVRTRMPSGAVPCGPLAQHRPRQ